VIDLKYRRLLAKYPQSMKCIYKRDGTDCSYEGAEGGLGSAMIVKRENEMSGGVRGERGVVRTFEEAFGGGDEDEASDSQYPIVDGVIILDD
jgi:hypothetical protein